MILDVSVEELKPRDVIQLPSGRRVTIDRIEVCGDSLVVRWCVACRGSHERAEVVAVAASPDLVLNLAPRCGW